MKKAYSRRLSFLSYALAFLLASSLMLSACAQPKKAEYKGSESDSLARTLVKDKNKEKPKKEDNTQTQDVQSAKEEPQLPSSDELKARLNLTEDYRASFIHGEKPAEYQKYIVLHDTESEAAAADVINYWDSNGRFVAAHFVINKDGSIYQCVPLDKIAHHAGYGDAGHNSFYGVEDESRDDMRGATPIGDWAPDYGMNSYSIGIEMVHTSSTGEAYPQDQLEALDNLIAYIDSYYGFESQIIDHKMWRSYNSDTSAAFATYLTNYQKSRNHLGTLS